MSSGNRLAESHNFRAVGVRGQSVPVLLQDQGRQLWVLPIAPLHVGGFCISSKKKTGLKPLKLRELLLSAECRFDKGQVGGIPPPVQQGERDTPLPLYSGVF